MQVEVNGDRRITEAAAADISAEVEATLSRFKDRLTRVEVHFRDVNGPKSGVDHRCVVEARAASRQPVAVTHDAESSVEAVSGALDKLARLLDSTFDRTDNVKGSTSFSGLPT